MHRNGLRRPRILLVGVQQPRNKPAIILRPRPRPPSCFKNYSTRTSTHRLSFCKERDSFYRKNNTSPRQQHDSGHTARKGGNSRPPTARKGGIAHIANHLQLTRKFCETNSPRYVWCCSIFSPRYARFSSLLFLPPIFHMPTPRRPWIYPNSWE